jgi:predicted metal-dependent HD superfamily phosphohydrolase
MEFSKNLLAQYGQPHRRFHTSEHLRSLFSYLKGYSDYEASYQSDLKQEIDQDLMFWCVCFHDWFYRPGDPENESASAKEAAGFLSKCGYPVGYCEEVEDIILATKDHPLVDTGGRYPDRHQHHKMIMIDIDLAGLGSDPEEFLRTDLQIRDEFVPIVGEEAYEAGRPAWLKSMLDRPHIYNLWYFRSECEEQARVNLQARSL